jgi:uncharacterized membrane protein
MDLDFRLWLEYLLRFSHLVAGIAWIGSSFYFIWLDSAFVPPEAPRRNVEGEVFMVHGGFYYQVEKRRIYPGELPKVLHWFKWEATATWATGFLLLIALYFLRGASLLIDPQVHAMTQLQAVGLSLVLLAGSWLVYDFLWNARFVRSKAVSTVSSVIFFCVLIYSLTRIFSGRGAFILTGAIFGSLMLLNVWVRILPGQGKMLREAQAGQVPDYSVSAKSKTRSVHNTYFIFPVLFIMLSNHYPTIYNHPLNWLLLIILAVSGAATRHAMVTKNPVERWTLLPATLGLAALLALTATPRTAPESMGGAGAITRVEFEQVRPIIQRRCLECHSTHPTDDVYKAPPNGIVFETEAQFRAKADRIRLQVVTAKAMPLGNKTGMTAEERGIIDQWLRGQGF